MPYIVNRKILAKDHSMHLGQPLWLHRVDYNHLISNKPEWNNCLIYVKNAPKIYKTNYKKHGTPSAKFTRTFYSIFADEIMNIKQIGKHYFDPFSTVGTLQPTWFNSIEIKRN